jgi:hypothetical protein
MMTRNSRSMTSRLPVTRYLSSAEVARLGRAGKLKPFPRIVTAEALRRARPENVERLKRFVAETDYRTGKRRP